MFSIYKSLHAIFFRFLHFLLFYHIKAIQKALVFVILSAFRFLLFHPYCLFSVIISRCCENNTLKIKTIIQKRSNMNQKRLLKKLHARYENSDNGYILQLMLSRAVKSKQTITQRMKKTVENALVTHNLLLSEEELTNAILYASRSDPFTEEEILSLHTAVCLSLLTLLTQNNDTSQEEIFTLGNNAAYTLRSLEAADWEERYQTLSELEKTLVREDPLYPLCDKRTQNDIKSKILKFCQKHRLSERDAARLFAKKASETKSYATQGRVFFLSMYGISFLLTGSLFFMGFPIWCLPLLWFGIFEVIKNMGETVLRRFLPSHSIPKLELETIPESAKTLVVIPTLLTKEDSTAFDKIERFYLSNKDENVLFGLLFDLADASTETTERDAFLLAYAEEKIAALNEKYNRHFFLAIRKRSYSPSERKYIGSERKRGALIDFVNFIYGESNCFSHLSGDINAVKSASYLITLDADTNLYIGAVKEMVGAMLHPANRPIIENGAVRKGYGILQPRIALTAESACASRFARLLCGSGGIDPYTFATFDTYQNLFAEGIFCGKGIIDIAAFHTLIPRAFAKESILSHDLLEGNLLRAGYLSDVVLTDSFPKDPLAFYQRAHRWYRGDVQALPYAFSSPRNAFGKRHKNPANKLGRYKVVDNLRRLLTPPILLSALILSLLTEPQTQTMIALTVAITLVLPIIFSLFRKDRGLFRRFHSEILSGLALRLANLLFSLSSLAHHGIVAADALIRALFRMTLSRKHLLLWTTAAASDAKKRTGLSYVKSTLPGMAIGILLLTFAQSAPLRLWALAFLLFPLFLAFLAQPIPKKPRPLSVQEKALLTRYAFDHWSYFSKNVTAEDNYLPPDNIQEAPVRATAHRTSPTNIGMYLLSCLAARDYGFIDSKELLMRTMKTLETIEKLPKKDGHLYNWYNTQTLTLLGEPFISTVDSGNLIISIITLIAGLEEYAEEENALRRVIFRYRALIDNADFRSLYCEKRQLFYIAKSSDEPSVFSCYDLYMSESRTTGYYAVACGIVPKKHWEKLSRILVGKKRYTGLASWSGTTFEYFMPHLFLPIVSGSLSEEALAFCVSCQKKERENGMFGISESAYYAFDADMNYQYRANGNRTLALDAHAGKSRVLSPYSSFLMLAVAPRAALSNLEKLKAFGVYGEYGFYEAVDFAPTDAQKEYAIIKSYMSHHVGMSILAAANACFDNRFVKRFMKDPRMAAAKELLEERIPTDSPLFREKILSKEKDTVKRLSLAAEEKKVRNETRSDRLPKIAVLSNGKARITTASTGEVALSLSSLAVSYPTFSANNHRFLRVCFSYQNEAFSALPDRYSYSATHATFTTVKNKLTVKTNFTLHGEKNLFAISFRASGATAPVSPTLVFEPILTAPNTFVSHPFYRALSIEAYFSKEHEILFFHRRRKENEGELWLAISCEGEGALSFDTRKDILPFGYDKDALAALSQKELPGRCGATLSPLCVIRRHLAPRMGKASADFLISLGHSRQEAEEIILSARQKSGNITDEIEESLRPVTRRMLRTLGEDRPDMKYAELLLSALAFPEPTHLSLPSGTSLETLWRASISGDYPILALAPENEESDGALRTTSIFLKLHRLLREKGIITDLVFLCREQDNYHQPIAKRTGQLIAAEGQNRYLGKRGGVFIVSDPEVAAVVTACACLYLPLDKNTSPEEIYYRITGRKQETPPTPITKAENNPLPEIPSEALRVAGGFFHQNSFTVIKRDVDTPRSFVYASETFGTLVSASSPGYTWLVNAKECRLSEPSDDLLNDITGERIFAEQNGKLYDLCAMAETVEYSEGSAIYSGTVQNLPYLLKIGIDVSLPVKLILATLPENMLLRYHVSPSFSLSPLLRHTVISYQEGESIFFESSLSRHLSNKKLFLSPVHDSGVAKRQGYLFGVFEKECPGEYEAIRAKYHNTDAIEAGFLAYAEHYRTLFSHLKFHFSLPELDVLMGHFLPYQAYVIRMLARTGYHQSSGAFGFRDQLQDGMAMLHYDKTILQTQILRAARHQYREGDVQHWWHPIASPDDIGAGVRTRISDDLLFLPLAVAKYFEVTGDQDFLATEIPYLVSEPLSEEEDDRYEQATVSKDSESLYRHCMRAIEASLRLSERGLPLIGSGDWNDAFNRVGIFGKGESIFLARFMQIVFKAFSSVCQSVNDEKNAKKLIDYAKAIGDATEQYAWEDDRYLRGSYDSGAPLGSRYSRECQIDSLSQSFSVLAEGENDRTAEAMNTAYRLLWQSENKLYCLFDPPFPSDKKDAGYISAYCEGIRENGGQYNHGALFSAKAFFRMKEARKAFDILEAVNPCARSLHPTLAPRYRSEPYALCGDIYTSSEYGGRGGWSLYTGAAGWFLRVVIEDLVGYCEHADHFTLNPTLPEKIPSFSMRLSQKNTVYHISVKRGDKKSILLDKHRSENLFFFDGKHHILEMDIEK